MQRENEFILIAKFLLSLSYYSKVPTKTHFYCVAVYYLKFVVKIWNQFCMFFEFILSSVHTNQYSARDILVNETSKSNKSGREQKLNIPSPYFVTHFPPSSIYVVSPSSRLPQSTAWSTDARDRRVQFRAAFYVVYKKTSARVSSWHEFFRLLLKQML